MSDGQSLALQQLHELVEASRGAIELPVGEPYVAVTGFLVACVSLDCAGTPHAPSGLRLRPRERIIIHVPAGFPHEVPSIQVPHRRWAGTPHVQWGSWICLYAATSIEWVPADGLLGLFDRLRLWLERASLGELDPDDAPLHPPVAYPAAEAGSIVVRTDIGALGPSVTDAGRRSLGEDRCPVTSESGEARFLVGVTEEVRPDRRDVVSWMELEAWRDAVEGGEMPALRDGLPIAGALAVLTGRELSFEYPRETAAVVEALGECGVAFDDLFRALAVVARGNSTLARRNAIGDTPTRPELFLLAQPLHAAISDGC